MTVNRTENTKPNESNFSLQPVALLYVALMTGLMIIIPLTPALISNLTYSFGGEAPRIYWYLSRSAGFVALSILWVSMALGLGLTNKMARLWPGAPAAFAIHEYTSLLGLAFAIYHGLVLMGDHYVDFSLPRLLTPFSIDYRTFWVGLGQIGFYVWLIVAASFYVRQFIGQKVWRLIHFINFATYMMGLFHGIYSGTDSVASWAHVYYWVSGTSLLAMLAYRLYISVLKPKISASRPVAQPVQASAQAPKASPQTPMPVPLEVKSVPESLLLEQGQLHKFNTDNSKAPAVSPSIPIQKIGENSDRIPVDEKTEPQTLEIPAVPAPSHAPANSPLPASEVPNLEVKATSPSPAEKLDKTYRDNIVRVRIFKEPTTRPIEELQKYIETKQAKVNTLILKLKKDFFAIPVQPTTPNRKSRRIVFSDD